MLENCEKDKLFSKMFVFVCFIRLANKKRGSELPVFWCSGLLTCTSNILFTVHINETIFILFHMYKYNLISSTPNFNKTVFGSFFFGDFYLFFHLACRSIQSLLRRIDGTTISRMCEGVVPSEYSPLTKL